MELLSKLSPAKGSVKKAKRIARGQGSGHGGTATRGHKGAGSRSGYSQKRHHEGGQMAIQMRLPKRGFKNINRIEYKPFSLTDLQYIADKHSLSSIDVAQLKALRLIQQNDKVKILGGGELTSVLQISAHAFSASAKEAIEKIGGTTTVL
ncbi:MAG: 50S ribosomal protein L15 [Sphingobacteriales bacterium]|jgi:large subunit ribosomal protein L15|nr:50S ribosomal protein L15 [Sphingobacteriales bacterium]MCC7222602.1 50S ribosomal protein L15 [Chitinophagales bacterium]